MADCKSEDLFFHCPKCGQDSILTTLGDTVFSSPSEPCIICTSCEAEWAISLHEIETDELSEE
jgi:transcription elongation factor Elf1